MATLFSLSNLLVLPFWLLMILVPTWRWSQRIMQSPLVAAGPAILYVLLVVPVIGSLSAILLRPTLPALGALLATPQGTTLAWLHFLAFDLFVGRWAYLDSRERKLNPLLMVPVLSLILLFGPLGFLLYLGVRAAAPRAEPRKQSAALGAAHR